MSLTSRISLAEASDESGCHAVQSVRATRPYTPETLSERWSCSAEKVRQMIHRGELAAFPLGKLFRIPALEVERYECAHLRPVKNMNSFHTEASSPLLSERERLAVGSRLARLTLVSPE
ncbi:hypothetical protein GCM10023264_25750 [Sphingomonas daechungensis]|uniref:Excisionase family DNA-binding protein n=2 Tax=Sphingomonas daechungensis TaxID=1176646 RepID=A0ABX6T1A1_9SPHN|nr:excisionase family DNA-binding protein [Sphingomonas daechungensis]